MRFHFFGDPYSPVIVLLHGIQTPWQVWQKQIDHFQMNYFVIVPALSGHEEETVSEFESLEREAEQIENECLATGHLNIFAVCGLSMGGVLAYRLRLRGKLTIQHLIMDGAPLVAYNKWIQKFIMKQYLSITHKVQMRDKKTVENFSKFFLPKNYLPNYLKIADNMSDQTIKNIVRALGKDELTAASLKTENKILYLHGTKGNEFYSKKSAKQLKQIYPEATILAFKGCAHGYIAIYEPEEWLRIVEEHFNNILKKN